MIFLDVRLQKQTVTEPINEIGRHSRSRVNTGERRIPSEQGIFRDLAGEFGECNFEPAGLVSR
jgi:hypothetical protein